MNATESVEKDPFKGEKKSRPKISLPSHKQLAGIAAALVIAILLTVTGFISSCMCFGMLLIAIILYMIPHYLKVESLQIKVLVGILFVIITIPIGAFIVAPSFVDNVDGTPGDNDYFKNIDYDFNGGNLTITADVENVDSNTVRFYYGEVQQIGFNIANAIFDKHYELTVTSGVATGTISLDTEKLFVGYLAITKVDNGEMIPNNDTKTGWTFLTEAFEGDVLPLALTGCATAVGFVAIVYFLITIFSYIMRNRFEKTREKMENDGRLYPPGYGRCEKCESVVLPGEVNCRKCGAYIDRPNDMKPNKKDFFECSDCGAEVPGNAKVCPKCGATFDEEESVVVHSDGTVDVTKETFECSECGAIVPSAATFCPKCGAKFEE